VVGECAGSSLVDRAAFIGAAAHPRQALPARAQPPTHSPSPGLIGVVAHRASGRPDDSIIRGRVAFKENLMYIGGILGTILIVALIVYLVRRI